MQWLIENIGTIIVLIIVATISGFATFSIIRNKKKGGCSCGCGCGDCPMSGKCHPNKQKQEPIDESDTKKE